MNSLEDRIRSAGFRVTKSRLLLMQYFAKHRSPASIREVADAVAHTLDRVTVYRSIDAFCKAGLIRHVDLHAGRSLYEIADQHDDHHHIVCTSCNRVSEFHGCRIDSIAARALRDAPHFASIQSHSLELFGICNKCTV